MRKFNFNRCVRYDATGKARFHSMAKARLRAVAKLLELSPGDYDLRSNIAGPAVSGEITLHTNHVYVQVAQPFSGGPDTGILIRTCNGRDDFCGGHNTFAPLALLNDPAALAVLVDKVEQGGLRMSPDQIRTYAQAAGVL
ncbi:hypothetical protein [Bradyrhizobium aeschynomenes]|uniref:hypothetical protein n=1 Tax=Bradyrhizobium aeschynomenes TaxID=2734909 RepID=UPI001AEDAF48|nr:hypothetical protein [Bradyrhizobium aeschynomenes]